MKSSPDNSSSEPRDTRDLLDQRADTFANVAFRSGDKPTADARDAAILNLDDPQQSRFGDYELLELIGEGGMGLVYRARQVSLDREVAVKLLAADPWPTEDFLARFMREARNAARVSHPNIVTIHEIGIVDVLPFFSMQLVRGGSLAERLRRGESFPPQRAARLARDCAEALDCAHRLGVLHLDLKPANILIDEDGKPHVADFGLARRLEQDAAQDGDEITGTPSYMAPEQAAPETQRISPATDVWGLGAILYELAIGEPPFVANSARATLDLVAEGKLRSPRQRNPALPRDLEAIILRCLAHDSSQRYASAHALADDLGRFIDKRPVGARPPTLTQRATLWVAREKSVAAVAALAFVALAIAGVISSGLLRHREMVDRSIAVLPFESAGVDPDSAYLVDGMRSEILTRLANVRDIKVIARSSADRYTNRPGNLRSLADELGVATVLEGSVQQRGKAVHIALQLIDTRDDRHLWAQSYDEDIGDVFGFERDVAGQVTNALQAQLSPDEASQITRQPTQSAEAYDAYLRALQHFNPDETWRSETHVPDVEKAVSEYHHAISIDPNFALAWAKLSQTLIDSWTWGDRNPERIAEAKRTADRALALQPTLGEAHVALALYALDRRDSATASREIQQSRRSLPNDARLEIIASSVEMKQGQFERALASNLKAVSLDPRGPAAHTHLAYAYQLLRRYAEADRELARAADLGGDPWLSRVWRAALLMQANGDLSRWRAVVSTLKPGSDEYRKRSSELFFFSWLSRDFRAAVKFAEATTFPNLPYGDELQLPRELYLASTHALLHEDALARPLYAHVREQMQAAIAADPDEASFHAVLGLAAAGLGLKEEALREAHRGMELMPPNRDAFAAPDYIAIAAQVHVVFGETDEAFALLDQLVRMPGNIGPGYLKIGVDWDPLRADPRFQQLIDLAESQVESRPQP